MQLLFLLLILVVPFLLLTMLGRWISPRDEKISKYFTDAPESWKSITVRHLEQIPPTGVGELFKSDLQAGW